MKRNVFFLFLILQLTAAVAFAQIQVKKSVFAPQVAKTFQIYTADVAYLPSGKKLLMLYRVLSDDRTELDYWLGTLDPHAEEC